MTTCETGILSLLLTPRSQRLIQSSPKVSRTVDFIYEVVESGG